MMAGGVVPAAGPERAKSTAWMMLVILRAFNQMPVRCDSSTVNARA